MNPMNPSGSRADRRSRNYTENTMKLSPVLALTGLALATFSSPTFADCSPACVSPDVCRYNNGTFYCASPHSRFKGSPGGAVVTNPRSTATGVGSTAAAPQNARTTGPKTTQSYSFGATQTGSFARADAAPKKGATSTATSPGDTATHERKITSPRDPASGQATGRRQHKPVQ